MHQLHPVAVGRQPWRQGRQPLAQLHQVFQLLIALQQGEIVNDFLQLLR